MSNLSELLPAGGAAKEFEVVASGTLPDGKPVILNSDGTVTVVTQSSTAITQAVPLGSETTFHSASLYGQTLDYIDVQYDPFNAGRFIVCYTNQANSNYGTMRVGNTSNGNITFGSVIVFNSDATYSIACSFDPNTENQFILTFKANPDAPQYDGGVVMAGLLNSTNGVTSFGSRVSYLTTPRSYYNKIQFDPLVAGRFVVIYYDIDGSVKGEAICGNVNSSQTISLGSYVQFSTGTIGDELSISFDPNTQNKFIIIYKALDNSGYPRAVVGVISGTNTITFGTAVTFYSGSVGRTHGAYDPNEANKFVCAYDTGGSSGQCIVGTVSGTTSSFGSSSQFSSDYAAYCEIAFDPNTAGKFVVFWVNFDSSSDGTVSLGTRSGNSLSYISPIVVNAGSTLNPKLSFDHKNIGQFVLAYKDSADSKKGKAVICQIAGALITTNLTASNLVGYPTQAYTNGQTALIIPQGGVSTNQTSLTAGSTYYVQKDATLATTADSLVTVVAGKAISATSLLLKGNS